MDQSKYKFLTKKSYVRYYTLDNDFLCPLVCAYEKSPVNKKQVGPWQLQRYVVHYILSGEGFYFYNHQKITIKKGNIFAIVPNKTVAYMQNPENPWVSIWFEFSGSECMNLFKSVGLNENNLVYTVQNQELFEELFLDLMHNSINNKDSNGYITLSKIYEIFGKWKEENSFNENKKIKDDLFNNIVDYIHLNYSYDISSSSIAKLFFISPQYLAKIFNKHIGMPPATYISTVRLKHAAQMLINTNLPIKSISESVGFSNPYYFSSVFKKTYLYSPKRYRIVLNDLKEINEDRTVFYNN